MVGEDGGQVSSELRVVSKNKANAYFGGQAPSPQRYSKTPIFLNVVNKLWDIMGGEDGGQVSSDW